MENPGSLNSYIERTGLPEDEALEAWSIELNEFRMFVQGIKPRRTIKPKKHLRLIQGGLDNDKDESTEII